MRLQDKIAINNMRLEGHSPSVIAATLGLPNGTVRSHIHRNPVIPGTKACQNCGKPLMQPKGRREKKFCSDACRMAWWNSHRDQVNRASARTVVCGYCGTIFEAFGQPNRKYCSIACSQASRRKVVEA